MKDLAYNLSREVSINFIRKIPEDNSNSYSETTFILLPYKTHINLFKEIITKFIKFQFFNTRRFLIVNGLSNQNIGEIYIINSIQMLNPRIEIYDFCEDNLQNFLYNELNKLDNSKLEKFWFEICS